MEPPAAEGSGGLGSKPQATGQFFLEKKLFQCHWITFRTYSQPYERSNFLKFESQLEKFKLFNPPFTCNLSPKHA